MSSSTINLSIEVVKKLNISDLEKFLRRKNLNFNDNDFRILHDQNIDGSVFMKLTYEQLVKHPLGISAGKATKLITVIKELNSQKQPIIDLKSLDKKIDLIRSELENIYKVSARLEVAKISGSHYSSKFEISDLNGLVWLSLPQIKFSSEKPKLNSPVYVQVYHADKLANYIYNKKMRNKLEESISYIHSLPNNKNFIESLNNLADRAEKALDNWKTHEKNSARLSLSNRLFLANTKFLGVMLITSYILDAKIAVENNHAPFYEVLELDIHGKPTSYLDIKNVSIEIGEIKLTTKNIFHGYRQLLIRLAALGFVIEAMNSKNDEAADYRCDLVGVLYVPKVPPVINISSEWENGINFPKGTKHIIRIVAVGDKP